jgi:hypothetical protein
MWPQARLLGRTFFARLFESDLMPQGLPQVQLVVWSTAILATPGLAVVMLFTPKYARLASHGALLSSAVVLDRTILFTLSMIGMGFAALVVWEGIFPDRRDGRILSPLPVRTSTIVLARLGALLLLFSLFTAGTVALPGVLFPVIVSGYQPAPGPFIGIFAHVIAIAAGCTFAFFSLVALQCALLVVFGRALAHRLSVVLQVLFTIALLQMALLLPRFGLDVREGQLAPDWMASGSAGMFPSVWFVGLHDVLSGASTVGADRLAAIGSGAAGLVLAGTLVLYAASYRRLTRQALETAPGTKGRRIASRVSGAVRGLSHLTPRWAAGTPVARAVCAFTLRTLIRSRQHRMLLAVYIAVPLAFIVTAVLPGILGHSTFARPTIAVASATPVLIFFMLVGLRVIFGIPVEPKANWAIRVREPLDRGAAMKGVRRAMFAAGVIPPVVLTIVILAPLWGVVAALRHAVFCTVMAALLTELLLLGFCKVPFTCTYYPARSGFKVWPAFCFGFVWYSYSITAIELVPLRPLGRLAVFYVLAAAVFAVLAHVRARRLAEMPGLVFEEVDPDAIFEGFHLSEGLAAAKP